MGIACVQTGFTRVQFRLARVQIGMTHVQTGFTRVRFRLARVQIGMTYVQTGFTRLRFRIARVQIGMTHVQTGFTRVRFQLARVQIGMTCVQTGFTRVRFRLARVQIGTTCVQTGFTRVRFRVARVQIGMARGQMGIAYVHWASSSLVDTLPGMLPMVSIYARLSGRRAFLTKPKLSAKTDQSNHHHPTTTPISGKTKRGRLNKCETASFYLLHITAGRVLIAAQITRLGLSAVVRQSLAEPCAMHRHPRRPASALPSARELSRRAL